MTGVQTCALPISAEALARVYGADKTAARMAGLLHDWDKGYDDPGILARADELGMELDAELSAMPRVLHGLTAAVALGRAFPELPPKVLAAVERHTLGAVDYITKPFVIGALQRKIKAMFAMLEHHKPAKDIYDDGRLFLDFSEQTASLNGKPLTLSPMEYKMLNLFRKNPRQVLTRGQLLEKLWDIDERFVDEHTLTTSISRIRSKIESDGGTPYIKTVYGMGYQWTGGEAK